jgi:3-dehydroquinate dehydratase II
MSRPILVLNGPNLNMLGKREPALYGTGTLADIEAACVAKGRDLGVSVDFRQTNSEGTLIDWVQGAAETAVGIVINAGAYTHTSIALHDALRAAALPVIEVHLSNVFARETFRHHSFISPVAKGVIVGLGPQGYTLAIEALYKLVDASKAQK